jgi:hypothetical protein
MPDDFPDDDYPLDDDSLSWLSPEDRARLRADRWAESQGLRDYYPKYEANIGGTRRHDTYPPNGGSASSSGYVLFDPEQNVPTIEEFLQGQPGSPIERSMPVDINDPGFGPASLREREPLIGIRPTIEEIERTQPIPPPTIPGDLNNSIPIDLGPSNPGDLTVPEPAIRPPAGYTPPIAQPTQGFQAPVAPLGPGGFTAPLAPLPRPGFTMPEDPELRPPYYRYP